MLASSLCLTRSYFSYFLQMESTLVIKSTKPIDQQNAERAREIFSWPLDLLQRGHVTIRFYVHLVLTCQMKYNHLWWKRKTKDENCYFVEALIRCNLKSLSSVCQRMAAWDKT
ncbi:hypothetical protein F2Q68_00041871 [Brassica cretica]|uniref:Uncharacterized protein n=1 Tax=Brassica cretica TaxID=69181 RepID=A0A8S9MES7_BRACR|nr:hypothetical protein F2Q68_00041871 [Brassica cretica]